MSRSPRQDNVDNLFKRSDELFRIIQEKMQHSNPDLEELARLDAECRRIAAKLSSTVTEKSGLSAREVEEHWKDGNVSLS